MSNISAIKMLRAIQKVSEDKLKLETMIVGTVTQVDPLEIDIGHDVKLPESMLFLGQMCRPHKVTIPHTHKINVETEYGKANGEPGMVITTTGQASTSVVETQGHKHKIKDKETDDVHKENCGTDYEDYVTLDIYPKLEKGDHVLMFAFNNFQRYYVAERLEK